ncbi:MAG: redoxin domain-containing protein [Planctomycetes bacterium]|nr:redoxin domain-containing protein [Planctomycetota bacterium]
MARSHFISGFCILSVALCLPGCEEKPRARQRPPGLETLIGNLAPDMRDVDLQGNPLMLSDYRGRVVVLSFWAEY